MSSPVPLVWAALFATFYYVNDKTRSADEKATRLVTHLKQKLGLTAGSDPDTWQGEDAQQQIRFHMRYFTPDVAHAQDVRVVQLVLSDIPHNRAAANSWSIMRQKLEQLLNNDRLGNLCGYTFIYQAVIPDPPNPRHRLFGRLLGSSPTASPSFTDLLTTIDLNPLLALARRLKSQPDPVNRSTPPPNHDPDQSDWLAETLVLDGQGKLWLLNIPILDQPTTRNHRQKGSVYLALSFASANHEITSHVIYGQNGLLFMPDLIAHKGYNQIRQYRLHDKQQKISTQITSLTYNVKQQKKNIQSIADFDKLRISLARQLYNYNLWMERNRGGGVLEYHLTQLKPRFKELEFIVEEGQNMLQAADTAIAIQQTRLEWRTQILLAVIGIGLGLSQIVNETAATALLHWWYDTLKQNDHERLSALGIQLGIIIAGVIPLLLFRVIKWISLVPRRLKAFIPPRRQRTNDQP